MIDRKALLADLQKQIKSLEKDLREQVENAEETVTIGGATSTRKVRDRLKAEYDHAFVLGRTAATWTSWRDERVTQAAAAWVLGTVFLRFCEDNGLLSSFYLAGPSPDSMLLAEEAQEEFFSTYSFETDRGWLLAAFAEIAESQAGALLFDEQHNALYQIPISHDEAKKLIAFWRRRGEHGRLIHDFVSDAWDTRFLGDLYQDLSEAARKRYALLQTPEFVEEFILDYTLTPAIAEFGHDVVRVIDPTCGSGHFVLGAFRRLLKEWVRLAPARDKRDLVRLALQAVNGVDLNAFAIAIARFRLFIAALRESGFTTLSQAKGYEFPLNLAIGDSLIKERQMELYSKTELQLQAAKTNRLPGIIEQSALFSTRNEQTDLFGEDDSEDAAEAPSPVDELAEFAYATEDLPNFPGILKPRSYHVVVGNPPYITVKDKSLNELYRRLYSACSGQYALSVPFAQRFFELALSAGNDGRGAGYVGQITANSFMKREFGRKLIENFFAHEVELTHIVDTSGAYIPGHGTPTVILFGSNRKWKRRDTIHMVMGIRGEPTTPTIPFEGKVWQAILGQIAKKNSESEWVGTSDAPRSKLARHPWSLTGGGARGLKELIRKNAQHRLDQVGQQFGFVAIPAEEDAFIVETWATARRKALESCTPLIGGAQVRDFSISPANVAVWPYGEDLVALPMDAVPYINKMLWPNRRVLQRRKLFGTPMEEISRFAWHDYRELYRERLKSPRAIVFADITTHNHFAFSWKGLLFNRSAPVVKLAENAPEELFINLTGLLNSSLAGFWLREHGAPKGGSGIGRGIQPEIWMERHVFNATNVRAMPLPSEFSLAVAQELDALGQKINTLSPVHICAENAPTSERLIAARAKWLSTRGRMFALQEELDWMVYSLYGLLDEELAAPAGAVPNLNLGERAFEIVLARKVQRGEVATQWFARHSSKPIIELPVHWPDEYKAVVERRIALIESDRNIGLLERPEYKRRWALIKDNKPWGWPEQEAAALRGWLLDRFDDKALWFHEVDGMVEPQPRILTTAQLADLLRRDADVIAVAELYAPGKDLEAVVANLVADEHVPYLAQLRYKDSGLATRVGWEDVWDRQRQEDAAKTVLDAIVAQEEEPRSILKAADKGEVGDEDRQRATAVLEEILKKRSEAEAVVRQIRNRIPVPTKYSSGDFQEESYWRNRGKLDVPKERFISYPYAGGEGDPALLLGWAGWDHREQAQALAVMIVDREQNHGWGVDRLTPLLAGLREVLPWVRQWHDEFDPEYGASPAAIYDGFLTQTRDRLHLTDDDLTEWRPRSAGHRKK
ncbi:BREX-2 system adenine-specific DNA-methyltransferase PglX [Nonomuraea sp. NPDC048892]|uniref:BREX-2 system adenine-specific DNA-methyltransferase PglX n=1 Tax=Nonomuraea sp. NPDC048892 TaxID=3154624 RepID=UPI0033E9CBCA